MKEKMRKRTARVGSAILSAVMGVTLIPRITGVQTVQAALSFVKNANNTTLSTSGISAPKEVNSCDEPWAGSYVWFGTCNDAPTKYRVLSPNTTDYGGNTMFLDSEDLLFYEYYDDGRFSNEWEGSYIQSQLNGWFLEEGFSNAEEDAIAISEIDGGVAYPDGSFEAYFYGKTVGLNDRIFLLDASEIMNPEYGYSSNPGYMPTSDWSEGSMYWTWLDASNRIKTDDCYWLRSAYDRDSASAGMVDDEGRVNAYTVDEIFGVAPALNLNVESIIFSTQTKAPDSYGVGAEYKLTVADSDLGIEVPADAKVKYAGTTVTVPYTITGSHASSADHATVLVTDRKYYPGNTNDATILYYAPLDGTFDLVSEGTFTLPSGLQVDSWGSDYHVYILAEDISTSAVALHESDYASVPYELSRPEEKDSITISVTGGNYLNKAQASLVSTLANNSAIFKLSGEYDVDKDLNPDFALNKVGNYFEVIKLDTCSITGSMVVDLSRFPDMDYKEAIFVFTDDPEVYLNEIRLTSNATSVKAGVLPSFTFETTTQHASLSGTHWLYWTDAHGSWYGFAGGIPIAENDGSTHYGIDTTIHIESGYSICSTTKLFYNGVVYNGVGNTRFQVNPTWGADVTIDLGLASGTNITMYTVTFDSQGGSDVYYSTQTVPEGYVPNQPYPDPEKLGFWFEGWYTDSAKTNKYDFTTPLNADTTLYANYTEADMIDEIRLYSDMTYAPVGVLPDYTATTTTEHLTSVSTRDWSYWTDAHGSWYGFGGATPTGVVDGVTSYGIRLDVHTEEGYQIAADARVYFNDIDVTDLRHTEVSPSPGWGAMVHIGFGYATYMCTISFDANGGTGTMDDVLVPEGSWYELPACAFTAPEGKRFKQWVSGAVGEDILIAGDTTLTAVWEDIPVYGIDMHVYDAYYKNADGGAYNFYVDGIFAVNTNGGCHGVSEGHEVTIEAYGFTGKTFVGFYKDDPVTGTLLSTNPTYTFIATENVTIYAVFDDEGYVLTLDANGGIKGPDWVDSMNVGAHSNFVCVPPPESFLSAPEGKEFIGYRINGVEYSIGTSVILSGDTTAVYLWKDIEYNVTYDANGGTTGSGWVDSTKLTYGSVIQVEAPADTVVKAPDGKEFAGLLINGVEYAVGGSYTVYADTSITYLWKDAAVTPGPDPVTPDPGTPDPGTPDPSNPGDPAQPQPGKEPSFEDFIERMYVIALNRPSEPDGKAFWMDKVMNDGFTGGRVAIGFLIEAPEFLNRGLTDEQFVDVLYRTFFDREADEGGKAFWMGHLATDMTREQVVRGFIDSTEWCNLCASYGIKSGAPNAKAEKPSNNALKFATRLYTECLGREPDADGLMFWALRLTNLESSGYEAALGFFTSDEFKQKGIGDDEFIHRLYRTFMGRDEDPDGFAFWKSHLGVDMTREELVKGFAQSQEFTNICNEYGIDKGI